ncbi:unnamed protein product [Sphagnum jensenii]
MMELRSIIRSDEGGESKIDSYSLSGLWKRFRRNLIAREDDKEFICLFNESNLFASSLPGTMPFDPDFSWDSEDLKLIVGEEFHSSLRKIGLRKNNASEAIS